MSVRVTKASREGASFITSQSELGVIRGGGRGGGGVGQNSWVFSAIPHLELGKTPFWARFRSFGVSGFLDVQGKNKPPLMLLMLAWACRLMLLMLVVSWPRCLGVSADAADAGRIVATLCVLL